MKPFFHCWAHSWDTKNSFLSERRVSGRNIEKTLKSESFFLPQAIDRQSFSNFRFDLFLFDIFYPNVPTAWNKKRLFILRTLKRQRSASKMQTPENVPTPSFGLTTLDFCPVPGRILQRKGKVLLLLYSFPVPVPHQVCSYLQPSASCSFLGSSEFELLCLLSSFARKC